MPITLITGANKGLGFEAARRLTQAGHEIYVGARSRERGLAAAEELGARFLQLDVTDDDSVRRAAAELERDAGRLDVLLNNAGISGPRKQAVALTAEDASEVFETNAVGNVRVTHAFLPLLERSETPRIVNVASGTGSFTLVTDPSSRESEIRAPLYSASKSAITMLTLQYAKALPHMRINAADPGETPTDLNEGRGDQTIQQGTDAIVELAQIGADGPTGAFIDRHGTVGW